MSMFTQYNYIDMKQLISNSTLPAASAKSINMNTRAAAFDKTEFESRLQKAQPQSLCALLQANKRRISDIFGEPGETRDQLPRKRCRVAARKQVHFAPTATVVHPPAPFNPPVEGNELWYQDADYAAFEQDRRACLAAMECCRGDVSLLDPTKYCLRGLEHHLFSVDLFARQLHATRCRRMVLQQQYNNSTGGCMGGDDTLPAVARLLSEQGSRRAHLRAVLDHALESCGNVL